MQQTDVMTYVHFSHSVQLPTMLVVYLIGFANTNLLSNFVAFWFFVVAVDAFICFLFSGYSAGIL